MDLKQELRAKLSTDNFETLHALLREFKEQGGSRDEAYRMLEELRAERPPESIEDRILELMDIVVGFCQERHAIW